MSSHRDVLYTINFKTRALELSRRVFVDKKGRGLKQIEYTVYRTPSIVGCVHMMNFLVESFRPTTVVQRE
jgi:hypothetical protein